MGRHEESKAPDRVVCRICRKVVPGWRDPMVGGGPLTDDHDCKVTPSVGHMLDAAAGRIEGLRNKMKGKRG